MPSPRLERWTVVEGDRAWLQLADCCHATMHAGTVVIARPHPVNPVFLHASCVDAALAAVEPDLVEFPTFHAARLAATVGLGDERCGVRLR